MPGNTAGLAWQAKLGLLVALAHEWHPGHLWLAEQTLLCTGGVSASVRGSPLTSWHLGHDQVS